MVAKKSNLGYEEKMPWMIQEKVRQLLEISRKMTRNRGEAKELMAAPMPKVDPPPARDTADPDTTTDHRPPCPCCGGRMIIVEVIARSGAPRGPPPTDAGVRTATP
jgi:hypothetical protein